MSSCSQSVATLLFYCLFTAYYTIYHMHLYLLNIDVTARVCRVMVLSWSFRTSRYCNYCNSDQAIPYDEVAFSVTVRAHSYSGALKAILRANCVHLSKNKKQKLR